MDEYHKRREKLDGLREEINRPTDLGLNIEKERL
jgi:hypothetical protein